MSPDYLTHAGTCGCSGCCASWEETRGFNDGLDLGVLVLVCSSDQPREFREQAAKILRSKRRNVFMVQVNDVSGSVFVKELKFFMEQRGFEEDWGKSWKGIVASDIESARAEVVRTDPRARSEQPQHDHAWKRLENTEHFLCLACSAVRVTK